MNYVLHLVILSIDQIVTKDTFGKHKFFNIQPLVGSYCIDVLPLFFWISQSLYITYSTDLILYAYAYDIRYDVMDMKAKTDRLCHNLQRKYTQTLLSMKF